MDGGAEAFLGLDAEPALLLQGFEEVAEEDGAGLARGLPDDVSLGGERGFAANGLDGVRRSDEFAVEDAFSPDLRSRSWA